MSMRVILEAEVVDGNGSSFGVDEGDYVSGNKQDIGGIKSHLQREAEVGPEARERHNLKFYAGKAQKLSVEFLRGWGIEVEAKGAMADLGQVFYEEPGVVLGPSRRRRNSPACVYPDEHCSSKALILASRR